VTHLWAEAEDVGAATELVDEWVEVLEKAGR
jgi:hypothetical protein